jgi:hypothetical protein
LLAETMHRETAFRIAPQSLMRLGGASRWRAENALQICLANGSGNRDLCASSNYSVRSRDYYRRQWSVAHDDFGSISALGVYAQHVHVETETGTIMVRFGSHPLASALLTDALHQSASEALRSFFR